MRRRGSERGAALPLVLAVIGLLQLLALAVADATTATLRTAAGLRERVTAFHAADAALTVCAAMLDDGSAPAHAWRGAGEPQRWRAAPSFDGDARLAFEVAPDWPGASRPPQCLVEAWASPDRPGAEAYLLTARGFGGRGGAAQTQAWMQLHIVRRGGAVEREWRSVAARPF